MQKFPTSHFSLEALYYLEVSKYMTAHKVGDLKEALEKTPMCVPVHFLGRPFEYFVIS